MAGVGGGRGWKGWSEERFLKLDSVAFCVAWLPQASQNPFSLQTYFPPLPISTPVPCLCHRKCYIEQNIISTPPPFPTTGMHI